VIFAFGIVDPYLDRDMFAGANVQGLAHLYGLVVMAADGEFQVIDQISHVGVAVAAAHGIDDILRIGILLVHPEVILLKLSWPEVTRGFHVIGRKITAAVKIRAGKKPPVAAFSQQGVPEAAYLGAVGTLSPRVSPKPPLLPSA
jgi:hypothetical protein